jgi:hypothetical protein
MNQVNAQIVNRDFAEQASGCFTYFRTSDVRPHVDDQNRIHIWNGVAYRASWGSSNVTSEVEQIADDVIQVEVTGWHKHTVGPEGGTYWFVRQPNGTWKRRTKRYSRVKEVLAA